MLKDEQEHKKLEKKFLNFLGQDTMFVLKGGTALMFCYGLDRMSEDLDFDSISPNSSMVKKVDSFCIKYNYDYVVKKNTETVQRCNIHVANDDYLKIETSYRLNNINPETLKIVNNIKTYSIDFMAKLKINAYCLRDTIRDLYDISFIINNYWDNLNSGTKEDFRIALMNKGLEQYDFLISQEKDELIDNEKLLIDFCKAYDKLNLRTDYIIENQQVNQNLTKLSTPSSLAKQAIQIANKKNDKNTNQHCKNKLI